MLNGNLKIIFVFCSFLKRSNVRVNSGRASYIVENDSSSSSESNDNNSLVI